MNEGKIQSNMKPEKTEYIAETAIYTKDGQIFTGKSSHNNIEGEIFDRDVALLRNIRYGFVTNTGRFVDRREAAQIAIANGQIEKPVRELTSEKLRFHKKLTS
jgi:hypothetical protein